MTARLQMTFKHRVVGLAKHSDGRVALLNNIDTVTAFFKHFQNQIHLSSDFFNTVDGFCLVRFYHNEWINNVVASPRYCLASATLLLESNFIFSQSFNL